MSECKRAIRRAGGLVGPGELAKRWGVSRQRVGQLTSQPGFPQPVGHASGSPVWLAVECDQWRAARPGPGRPRKATG